MRFWKLGHPMRSYKGTYCLCAALAKLELYNWKSFSKIQQWLSHLWRHSLKSQISDEPLVASYWTFRNSKTWHTYPSMDVPRRLSIVWTYLMSRFATGLPQRYILHTNFYRPIICLKSVHNHYWLHLHTIVLLQLMQKRGAVWTTTT